MSRVAEEIAAANAKFMEAFARGDAAGVANLYAEDGAVLPPSVPMLQGRAAIQAFWQGPMDGGVKKVTLTSKEVADHGDMAVEVGLYALYGDADQLLDAGKYLVVWARQHGDWQLHRDIWNSGA